LIATEVHRGLSDFTFRVEPVSLKVIGSARVGSFQSFDWSVIQNADWATIIETAVCFILIVAIVIEHRRLSFLKQEVQRVSEEVKGLASAEQRRFMLELRNKQKFVA
jgi:hypothetical protein